MKSKIPVLLCIDVEPDHFLVNRTNPEPWYGFEGTHRYFSKMRPFIEESTGSPARLLWSFRMDPQVAESYGSATWVTDRYTDRIKKIESHQDEFVAHTHMYRWDTRGQHWIEDFGNQDWVNGCIEMTVESFRKAFGRPCRIFRCGNYWLNTASVNLLEKLGIHYEMTVEPGRPGNRKGSLPQEMVTGMFPDFCRVLREPYEPRYDNFLKPSSSHERTITMIPLTSGSLNLEFHLRARWKRLRQNGFRYCGQNTPLDLWKTWKAPNTFDVVLDRALAAQQHPYLALAVRSCMGIGNKLEAIDHGIKTILAHPDRKRFVFCSPSDAMRILKESDA